MENRQPQTSIKLTIFPDNVQYLCIKSMVKVKLDIATCSVLKLTNPLIVCDVTALEWNILMRMIRLNIEWLKYSTNRAETRIVDGKLKIFIGKWIHKIPLIWSDSRYNRKLPNRQILLDPTQNSKSRSHVRCYYRKIGTCTVYILLTCDQTNRANSILGPFILTLKTENNVPVNSFELSSISHSKATNETRKNKNRKGVSTTNYPIKCNWYP